MTTDVERHTRERKKETERDREKERQREEEKIYDPHHSAAVYVFWILDKYLRSQELHVKYCHSLLPQIKQKAYF